jgi:DNA-binding MarR family transcriptional regulator
MAATARRSANRATAAARRSGRPAARLGLLDHSLAYHLRRAQLSSFRHFAERVRTPKATPTQFSCLVLIESEPGMSQVDLGGILGMDRATTMAVVDKLQQRRWVVRRPSTVDRRKHQLHLTPAGADALRAMKRSVARHEREFCAPLSVGECQQLLTLLRKLLAG